jgi:hypothetical protein
MKIGSGIVIGKDDAAGASAVRKPPEDRRLDHPNPNPKPGSPHGKRGKARPARQRLLISPIRTPPHTSVRLLEFLNPPFFGEQESDHY